ncbi:hypothetical protein EDB89DRAFT_1906472 [Lactarius sanguifluus]|nr:hypothetical protein EDB89DRAFT_1906472 [Lactarius sanguifluus]
MYTLASTPKKCAGVMSPFHLRKKYEYGHGNDIVVVTLILTQAYTSKIPASASPHAHPAPQGLKAHSFLPSLPHITAHKSCYNAIPPRHHLNTASPATAQVMTTAVARQLRRWRQGGDDNHVQGGQDRDGDSKSGRESATATMPKPPQYQVAATPPSQHPSTCRSPKYPPRLPPPHGFGSWPLIAFHVPMNISFYWINLKECRKSSKRMSGGIIVIIIIIIQKQD